MDMEQHCCFNYITVLKKSSLCLKHPFVVCEIPISVAASCCKYCYYNRLMQCLQMEDSHTYTAIGRLYLKNSEENGCNCTCI